jgi:hypothetical protein
MSLIDEKLNVFTEIGALTSITNDVNLPDPTNSLSSINNSKEIIPFMLDMLTVVVGSESLQTTVGEIMTTYIRDVEEDLRDSLKEQFSTFNSDQQLPSGFTGNGYTFKMADIDVFEKTKTDPNSDVGSLLFDDDISDFDNKLYESLVSPGTPITFGPLTLTYDDNTDTVNIKPLDPTQTIGEFLEEYIDDLNIINEKQFISFIIDLFFGTILSVSNKTLNVAIKEEELHATIRKIINQEEDIDITQDELRTIQSIAEEKLQGLEYYDVGCGLLPNRVTVDNLTSLIGRTTGNTDPLTVGEAYEDTLIGGFEDTDSTDVEDRANENAQTIKDGFFKRLIEGIKTILIESVSAPPQIRALMGMFSGFKNSDVPQLGDPIDDIKRLINQIRCLADNASSTINEFIFNLVKKELIKLIIPISKLILKEKINQYYGLIQSLIRLI